jgi:hypothetical protein
MTDSWVDLSSGRWSLFVRRCEFSAFGRGPSFDSSIRGCQVGRGEADAGWELRYCKYGAKWAWKKVENRLHCIGFRHLGRESRAEVSPPRVAAG